MNKVLSEIKTIPGIIGGFFFDSRHGIQAGNLPTVFKKENLNRIGAVLEKMYMMSNSGLGDITDLVLCYDESTISMRRIGKTLSFVIISDPSLNQNLLTMSMNMLAEDFRKIDAGLKEFGERKEENSENLVSSIKDLSAEDVIHHSPLATQLQGMQTALYKILGPMAEIIFKEAVRDWIQSEEPSETSIPGLLEILAGEIDDSVKEKKYFELISPYMNNIRDND